MKDEEIEKAEAHLEKAEADLKAAEAAEKAAEKEIKEAIEELKEAAHHEIHFKIQIDREHYTVTLKHMTGLQLRALLTPPLGSERDLFEVREGTDKKIGDEEVVEIRNGLRFFSAPAQINPGAEKSTPRS